MTVLFIIIGKICLRHIKQCCHVMSNIYLYNHVAMTSDAERVLERKDQKLGGNMLTVVGVESDVSSDKSCALVISGFDK